VHLNQLRYFVSAATLRSFTQAAQCHYITQTAITQQIKALEDSMGVALFDRTKRPVELTPAGRVFLQEARAILERAEGAVKKAAEAAKGATGSVRIGFEKGYERSELSQCLKNFHSEYPNVLLTCFREDTDSLAQKLQAGELDVIFAWDSTSLRGEPGIESRLDLRSGLSVALYRSHHFAGRKKLVRADLRDETIIYMSPSNMGNSFGDADYLRLYAKAGYRPNILLKSNDIESVLMMVAAEEGVSILPSYSVEKLTDADNLCFVPLAGKEEYEDVYMMWKSDRGNPALELFVSFRSGNEG